MGKTYYVPRSVKGETRLLYIFTVKSFISTVAIGLVGAVTCEALRNPSTAIVGNIPSLNKNVSVSAGKITFTTPV